MKAAAAIFILFCAVTTSGKLTGLSETALDLENLLKDPNSVNGLAGFGKATFSFGNLVKGAKFKAVQDNADHFEEDEGSGVRPTEEPANPIKDLIRAITLEILPSLKKLKEAREKQNHEFAEVFVKALKYEPDDDKVKTLFGEHVRELHTSCNKKKLQFAKEAHESGLFQKLPQEEKDFSDKVGEMIEEHKEGGDVFKAFVGAVEEHRVGRHLIIKLLINVGGMLSDTACEEDLEGYFEAIAKFIHEHEGDQYAGKQYCGKRWIKRCCAAIKKSIIKAPEGLKQRALRLMFDDDDSCSETEADFVRKAILFIKDKLRLDRKFASLMSHFQEEMKEIMKLYHEGKEKEADLLLADFVLSTNRKGKLIRYLLPNYLNPRRGKGNKPEEIDDDPSADFIEQMKDIE